MPNTVDEAKLTRDGVMKSSLTINDLPSNSETTNQRRKLEPIIKGRVIQRKKGFLQKLKESFVSDQDQSFSDYFIYDILVPSAKATFSEIGHSVLEMIFGDIRGKPRNVRRDGNRSYVSYTNYYNGSEDRRPNNRGYVTANDRYSFEEIIFSSRGEAEEVLSKLSELVEEYSLVSVADFFDLCRVQSSFTDNKYGWTSLKEAFTERIRDGYIIRLPRAKPLN